VAKVRHERAARESAEAMHMAERRRILELEVRKYHAMDRRSVGNGKPPLDQLLANGVVAHSGSTSGGNATRRRVARKRWSERTGSSVLELPLLRGVLELLL
jgi:hypothetical protein